ncbi:MAG: hypothetical protein HY853_04140 [Burkholderiales bacterium]|nr:hypothetical protein [Burkholderiales bacterium]
MDFLANRFKKFQGVNTMVHCYVTGIQFQLEEGFVLNRREAHNLLNDLQDRAASLRRVIDQLSPLDEPEHNGAVSLPNTYQSGRKKHRLVCKAVADALVPGFPEISLLMSWPDYLALTHLRRAAMPADRLALGPDGILTSVRADLVEASANPLTSSERYFVGPDQ